MIVKNKFSHADICEVIDSLVINDIKINKTSIKSGVKDVIETMKAISFRDYDDDLPCEEVQ